MPSGRCGLGLGAIRIKVRAQLLDTLPHKTPDPIRSDPIGQVLALLELDGRPHAVVAWKYRAEDTTVRALAPDGVLPTASLFDVGLSHVDLVDLDAYARHVALVEPGAAGRGRWSHPGHQAPRCVSISDPPHSRVY